MTPDEQARKRQRQALEGDGLAAALALREDARRPARTYDAPVMRLSGICEYCKQSVPVKAESARTCYAWDGKGEDPNRDRVLCEPCAIEHHEHWDEMWSNYYAEVL